MTLMSKTCRVGWRRRKTKSDGRGTGPELLITHYTSEQHIFLDVVAPLGTAMSICRSGINHIVMSLSSCDAKGAVPDSNSKMLSLRTLCFYFCAIQRANKANHCPAGICSCGGTEQEGRDEVASKSAIVRV